MAVRWIECSSFEQRSVHLRWLPMHSVLAGRKKQEQWQPLSMQVLALFSQFVDVANSSPTELLKDEKSDIDLAGPTLQSLKALLDNPPKADLTEAVSRYTRLVHGLLSASLLNIDAMR